MKQKLLIFTNIFLFITFISSVTSALIYRFIPGPLQGSEVLGSIHGFSGLSFSLLATIHIVLNWNWIKAKIFKVKRP